MRKFQKLMLSHRCVCVCWSTSTCISTTVKLNSEQKKSLTGFFKKNSHPQETTEIPCLPPQPPTSMLWSEVPSIINRNGCFFWRPPNTNFRRQHWIGGRGGHDLCGVVLHGMAVFFEEPGLRKDTIGWTHGCRQTREWWRHCVRESIGISLGGCLCVGVSVCLRGRICANMGCAKWNTCSDSLDTFLTWFRNVVGCTGCRSAWQARHFESVTALSCTPAMQRTCNTHATRHATWAFYL